jgi:UPF0176 protein
MSSISVAAFYKFVTLEDFPVLRESFLKECASRDIRGTILLAQEGINGTIAGSQESLDSILEFFHQDPRLADLKFRISYATDNPFYRLKVKLRNEIVTLGVDTIDPASKTGKRVTSENWNALISDPDVLIIDTRNDYETGIGTFINAIDPNTTSFRDFPNWLEKQDIPQDKKIAMFCTGGIRCEKSTAYLMEQGFENVYHLEGGILNYLETIPEEKSLWHGECFVFDERVSVGHGLEPGNYELCRGCRRPITAEDKHSTHFEMGVSCPQCYQHLTVAQKNGFRERQKQMNLAKDNNIEHICGSNRSTES